ncbi:ATP12 family chaperone protein [Neotabrizicola sp. sgz301269]|uniref:ATP12 family chaperone protein n=1 Tax=Neotabrizicola sp. sgz301269 TaxID=3276282 RepID=UPI0037704610
MSGWTAKRFWKAATVEGVEGGFTVRLDGRAVKTPAKAPLILPTLAMAQAVAAEWDAQEGAIRPETMPAARAAHSAIDKIGPQRAEVQALIVAYGGSDLLCYRAEAPEALVARETAAWDPLITWAATDLGAALTVTKGVQPIAQPETSLTRLAGHVDTLTDFELAAFHDLVAISGSLVLALAVLKGRLDPEAAWAASRIDEDWQAELWGQDEEAAETTARRKAAFLEAHRFWALCR